MDDNMITSNNAYLPEIDTSLPAYLFHQGTNYTAYEYLGAHGVKTENGYKYTFRVWAPNAKSISLLADFTNWEWGWQMARTTDGGVWEISVESKESLSGKYYKFAVTGQNGETHIKSDPFAFHSETLGKTASIIADLTEHSWHDGEWMKKRMSTVCPKTRGFKPKVNHFYSAPLNIYEVHLSTAK